MERSNYARLEARGEKLTIEHLENIAEALGVGLGELLGLGSGEVKNNAREAELEKRVAELEELNDVRKKLVINLEKNLTTIIDDFSYHIDYDIVKCALENDIIPKESYDKYIDVYFSENPNDLWWNYKPQNSLLKGKEHLSLFMTQEQILHVIHKSDSSLRIKIEGAYYGDYLSEIVRNAYDKYDNTDKEQIKYRN
jgi:transcriptional regulator with XRE-family HTH domain